jgi:predicted RNase H-like HicB family nuclease
MRFNVETELETDGRWIAEIPRVPGAMAYGRTENQAKTKAYAIARAIADATSPASPSTP